MIREMRKLTLVYDVRLSHFNQLFPIDELAWQVTHVWATSCPIACVFSISIKMESIRKLKKSTDQVEHNKTKSSKFLTLNLKWRKVMLFYGNTKSQRHTWTWKVFVFSSFFHCFFKGKFYKMKCFQQRKCEWWEKGQ